MPRPAGPRAFALLPIVLLTGCLSTHPAVAPPEDAPEFRPEAFFDGRTRGAGTLAIRGRKRQSVRVESAGRMEADGSFRLDQAITFDGRRTVRRTWRMRRSGARGYTATLTDAAGEVTGRVEGGVFHLRYRMRGPGVVLHQRLVVAPDGRTPRTLATVRVLGIPWARLDETITRVDTLR